MSIDLHTHSTYSDGVLPPAELVRRAASRGVTLLALTDHDETGGLAEAQDAAARCDVILVPGVEISAIWNSQTVHILGLDIDPRSADLLAGLASIRKSRAERATCIAAQLEIAGVPGALQGAGRFAGSDAAIGRSHFARYLVEQRHARNTSEAFRRYLAEGRAGHVPPAWPGMEQAVAWIRAAGGQVVLAHPDRYRLSVRARRGLFEAFAQSHGDAVELSGDGAFKSSSQIRLAQHFGFALSVGSDFHAPGKNIPDLGDVSQVPAGVHALWRRLRATA